MYSKLCILNITLSCTRWNVSPNSSTIQKTTEERQRNKRVVTIVYRIVLGLFIFLCQSVMKSKFNIIAVLKASKFINFFSESYQKRFTILALGN